MLSERFDDALVYARRLHRGRVPAVAHALAAAGLVLDHGGDEDEAIAALLLGAVVGGGGASALNEVEHRFGPRVAAIVAGCTEAGMAPHPSGPAREGAEVAQLSTAPGSVMLVLAADQLHSARRLLTEYRRRGEALWERHAGGREATLGTYRATVAACRSTGRAGELAAELHRVVSQIEHLAQSGPHEPTALA